MIELRPYQKDSVEKSRKSLTQGNRRVLIQAATGAGKTITACEIIRLAKEKGSRVWFLAPRRELVTQAHQELADYGVESSIYMAGINFSYSRVVVASIDTIASRYDINELPETDLVIVDEAHLFLSPKRLELLNKWSEKAIVLGLTATPARPNGQGLGVFYDDLQLSWTIEQLIRSGYLVSPRYFAPSKPDLTAVKVGRQTREYNEKQLNTVMNQPELIGDIVDNWFKLAAWKSTVVFCCSKAHSRAVCQEFLDKGVSAEHVDADTPQDERAEIFARVKSGETKVLCNVFIASYGLNIPTLEVAVIARPTKSLILYMQIIGRVLRPSEGKTEALIIDHSGCIEEHGFVEDVTGWSLEGDDISERVAKAKEEAGTPKEITCFECLTVFSGQRECPSCGHQMIPLAEAIPCHKADLEEKLQSELVLTKRWNKVTDWETKVKFFGELKQYARSKGWKEGWAAHQYRERSGVYPNDKRLKEAKPLPASALLTGWLRHNQIRKARSKK